MKRIKILPILFTLLAITIGMMLPIITLSFQNKKVESMSEKYAADSIEFKTENMLIDVMKLLANGYTEYQFQNVEATKDSNTIYQGVMEAFDIFQECSTNLNIGKVLEHDETPYIIVSDNLRDSYLYDEVKDNNHKVLFKVIVWKCTFETEKGYTIETIVDDTTGKVVCFTINNYNSSVSYADNYTIIKESVNVFADFCKRYYGTKVIYEDKYVEEGMPFIKLIDSSSGNEVNVYAYSDGINFYFNKN